MKMEGNATEMRYQVVLERKRWTHKSAVLEYVSGRIGKTHFWATKQFKLVIRKEAIQAGGSKKVNIRQGE